MPGQRSRAGPCDGATHVPASLWVPGLMHASHPAGARPRASAPIRTSRTVMPSAWVTAGAHGCTLRSFGTVQVGDPGRCGRPRQAAGRRIRSAPFYVLSPSAGALPPTPWPTPHPTPAPPPPLAACRCEHHSCRCRQGPTHAGCSLGAKRWQGCSRQPASSLLSLSAASPGREGVCIHPPAPAGRQPQARTTSQGTRDRPTGVQGPGG